MPIYGECVIERRHFILALRKESLWALNAIGKYNDRAMTQTIDFNKAIADDRFNHSV